MKWDKPDKGVGKEVLRILEEKWCLIFCNVSLAKVFNLNVQVQVHTRLYFLKVWLAEVWEMQIAYRNKLAFFFLAPSWVFYLDTLCFQIPPSRVIKIYPDSFPGH